MYNNTPNACVWLFSPVVFQNKAIFLFLCCLESCLTVHWSLWSTECVYFKTKSARLLCLCGSRTMRGNQVCFRCFPSDLDHNSLRSWMLLHFCWCPFFNRSVHVNLKRVAWYAAYCVLWYPARPVALQKPAAACSCLKLNYACVHAKPRCSAKSASTTTVSHLFLFEL